MIKEISDDCVGHVTVTQLAPPVPPVPPPQASVPVFPALVGVTAPSASTAPTTSVQPTLRAVSLASAMAEPPVASRLWASLTVTSRRISGTTCLMGGQGSQVQACPVIP